MAKQKGLGDRRFGNQGEEIGMGVTAREKKGSSLKSSMRGSNPREKISRALETTEKGKGRASHASKKKIVKVAVGSLSKGKNLVATGRLKKGPRLAKKRTDGEGDPDMGVE